MRLSLYASAAADGGGVDVVVGSSLQGYTCRADSVALLGDSRCDLQVQGRECGLPIERGFCLMLLASCSTSGELTVTAREVAEIAATL